MAISTELVDFVKAGLERGVAKRDLDDVLRTAGWDREQINGAIGRFADVDFAIPVPRPAPYLNTREAFMYVLMFSTLYLSAYQLGSLTFDLINLWLPDRADHAMRELMLIDGIRWSLSSMLVAFPVFLYMARSIGHEVRADVTRRASSARRQLTYLTLFIAAIVLIGDMTTLLYNFLGGELTIRFALKVATAAIIAGTAITYFLRELRQDERALSA